jgi:hypothetical protein
VKYLKKFIESVDINNKVDYDDLQIIIGFAEVVEDMIIDELGIEISRIEDLQIFDDNRYFLSLCDRTHQHIIPIQNNYTNTDSDIVISAFFRIKTKIKIKVVENLIDKYFNKRLKSVGFKYRDRITQWGDVYMFNYIIEY